MRKIILLLMLLPLFAVAAGPQIKFLSTKGELGNIKEDGGKVSTTYTYVNIGDAPLVILSATANCGCTQPKFQDKPLAPGDTAAITVTFDPRGKMGEFNKVIRVKTNSSLGALTRLRLKGVVIPSNK